MKKTLLIYGLVGLSVLSSCSSCGEHTGEGQTTTNGYSNHAANGAGINSGKSFSGTEEERLQADIQQMIEEQLAVSKTIQSKRVQEMIAGFELGMSEKEVKKHFLRMLQKKHLKRVLKRSKGNKKVYEYVYRLPLASGRSNTHFNFDHRRGGGVYKLVCEPQQLRKLSKAAFLEEVHNLLNEWYGEHSFQLPDQNGCARYVWIAGNRHLELYATPKQVKFAYTDLNEEIPPHIDKEAVDSDNNLLL
jgi:hypothetical protein